MNLSIKNISKTYSNGVQALKNVSLEELIVNNIHDYARVAIKIANDKKKLRTLKNHLSKSENTKKLFDSEKFTKDLEEI